MGLLQQQKQNSILMVQKSKICFVHEEKLLTLNASVTNSLQSSGSFVISLAVYLSSVLKLYPQSVVNQHERAKDRHNGKTLCPGLRPSEDYVQVWCDYLFQLVAQDSIVVVKDQAVLISPITLSYAELVKKSGKFAEYDLSSTATDVKQFILQTIYGVKQNQTSGGQLRQIAIINFSVSVTDPDKTAPKINLDCLFSGVFYKKGDRWTSFKILKGEVPTPEDIVSFETIILTGSSYSVNNMHQNIRTFSNNLIQAFALKPELKVVASCFGHQLISYAYGIKVEKRKQMRSLENLTLDSQVLAHVPYLKEMSKINTGKMRVYEFHSDYVTEVPKGFKNIAFSSGCENQMFISDNQRVITFQFHPEYSVQYIRWLERRWEHNGSVKKGVKQLYDEEHHHSLKIVRHSIRQLMDL